MGSTELLVILAIIFVLFGAAKIPQLGRGLGEGLRNFKSGLKSGSDDEASGTVTPRDPARIDSANAPRS